MLYSGDVQVSTFFSEILTGNNVGRASAFDEVRGKFYNLFLIGNGSTDQDQITQTMKSFDSDGVFESEFSFPTGYLSDYRNSIFHYNFEEGYVVGICRTTSAINGSADGNFSVFKIEIDFVTFSSSSISWVCDLPLGFFDVGRFHHVYHYDEANNRVYIENGQFSINFKFAEVDTLTGLSTFENTTTIDDGITISSQFHPSTKTVDVLVLRFTSPNYYLQRYTLSFDGAAIVTETSSNTIIYWLFQSSLYAVSGSRNHLNKSELKAVAFPYYDGTFHVNTYDYNLNLLEERIVDLDPVLIASNMEIIQKGYNVGDTILARAREDQISETAVFFSGDVVASVQTTENKILTTP